MPKSQFMEGLLTGIAARDRRLEREAADRARSMQYLLQNRQLAQTDVAQVERERAAKAQEQRSLDALDIQRKELTERVKGQERNDLFNILKEVLAGRFAPVSTETIEAPFTNVEIEPQQQIGGAQSIGIEVGNQRFAPTTPEYQAERTGNLLALQEGIKKRADRSERDKFISDSPDFANYLGPFDRIRFVLEGKTPDLNTLQEKIVSDIQNNKLDLATGVKMFERILTAQRLANPNFQFNQTVRASAGQIVQQAAREMSEAFKKPVEKFNDEEARQLETRARALALQLGQPELVTSVSEELRTLRPPTAKPPSILDLIKNAPNPQ